ncbi:unnamed protein product [Protopolystoma xenopodis]|uniref:Guanylate kinase-like domain-containing protein n=1 Tax=Protopolystoma xenopodis TaxID=117903 RepID=A0A448WDD0_9PLAT|nr:unnamed protein product [Protopolystoma xenopodis]
MASFVFIICLYRTFCLPTSLPVNEPHEDPMLSYIAVSPVLIEHTRPVAILGAMKDRIADDLICEFPEKFDTTRPRRPNEIEGRDYHFVVSRSTMEADITSQCYIEAGEYKGNLYGTHLRSVFELAIARRHCLLDVGGPALRRLESAGLPAIVLLLRNEVYTQRAGLSGLSDHQGGLTTPAESANGCTAGVDGGWADGDGLSQEARQRLNAKISRLIRDFAPCLTGQ